MFKILDGRDKFYQWDKNRKLLVEDSAIKEVHFCNRFGNCSLIRATYQLEGKTLVDVPNVILQDSFALHVYAYDAEYTKHEDVFNIVARTKPENYVNTEEDIRIWDELEQRLIDLEKNIVGENIKEAVEQYLQNNPIDAPVQSVNGMTGAVTLTAEDVGALPADTVIPSTTGLATEKYVDDAVKNVKPDLTGYATEKYVDDKIADIDFPEGADLSGYAKKTYVDEAIANIKHPTPDLSGYAKKSDIPSTAGLATETYVDNAIKNIEIPEVDVDLSNYYTKSEVEALIPLSGEEVSY